MEYASLFVAFSLGILGGAHCIGMCGGIIGALSMASDAKGHNRLAVLATYNVGRILSYLIVASIFYSFTAFVQSYMTFQVMRVLAGLLLIAMGLYLANWWRGLTYLESVGQYLWRYIQPWSQRLLPVSNYKQALGLGLLWGWLPCGLIYSALVYSATAENLFLSLFTMLFFALGTLPAVITTGLMAERLTTLARQKTLRVVFALLIMTYGLWVLVSAFMHQH